MAWNPSLDSTVVGYAVYALEENSTNATRIDVGSNMDATVGGLKEGLRYTFTVKAYNADGVESAPSNAATLVVPVPVQMTQPAPNGAMNIQFPIAPGHWYELQASTDLTNWQTIWQTGVATTYTLTTYQDLQSKTFPVRYYRLNVH